MKRQDVLKTFAVVALVVATGELVSGYAMGGVGTPEPTAGQVPTVIGIASHHMTNDSGSKLYRVWSDGLIEENRTTSTPCGEENWCGWLAVPGT